MTTRSVPMHRMLIGRLMRIPGVAVDLVRCTVGDDGMGWRLIVSGEAWIVTEEKRIWQGYTEDHLTGTPRLRRQSEVVRWILRNQEEWLAKLKIRRAEGTRMVDPKN